MYIACDKVLTKKERYVTKQTYVIGNDRRNRHQLEGHFPTSRPGRKIWKPPLSTRSLSSQVFTQIYVHAIPATMLAYWLSG